jgi:protein O-mannosyl-transferase
VAPVRATLQFFALGKRSHAKRDSRLSVLRPQPQSVEAGDVGQRAQVVICAALVTMVLAIYFQVRTHSFINYDDPVYVSNNPQVLGGLTLSGLRWALTSVHAAYWHPLTWISHQLDVTLFGRAAGLHLLVNVALHALNAVLLFLWLRLATGAVVRSGIVAALFAVHPLHVESVAWVAERKDVLSTLFLLLALHAYTRWVRNGSRGQYAWSVGALALGLMAKPMLVTFPFVLLLLDVWPFDRIRSLRGVVLEKLPYVACVVPAVLMTLRTQSVAMTGASLPFAIRAANASIAYVRYVVRTVWPSGLAIFYPFPATVSASLAILCALVLAAITVVALMMWRRMPWLPVGWLWFIGTLIPVIGLVQVGRQAMADRFTYIPHIGLFIAAVWTIAALMERRAGLRVPAVITAAVIILTLGIAAYVQTGYWRNSVTVFERAIAVTENNALAHLNLGAALVEAGQPGRAEEEYRAAAGFEPAGVWHLGYALALSAQGKLEAAAAEGAAAVEAAPSNAQALAAYGAIELARGRKAEAASILEKASRIAPDPQTLGRLALARGEMASARRYFGEAVTQNGDSPDAHETYAVALANDGDDAGAAREYGRAIELDPAMYDARMNLGALLSRTGHDEDAVRQFAEAATLRPQSIEPHVYLALAMSNKGRFAEAADHIRKAIVINHDEGNRLLTTAIRMAPRATAIDEYLQFLRQRAAGR